LLYVSPTQINAQVPFNLPSNTLHQIVVRRDVAASTPEEFSVSTEQPGIFTTNSQGTGQGAILGPDQSTIADRSKPAQRGQVVIIYCTGLGAVDVPIAIGTPAPSSPLAKVLGPVSVQAGGKAAQVLFAGLTPGFAG